MPRKHGKPKPHPKHKPTDRPGGKRPKTPADEDAAVSLSRLRANPRRGGRGR